MFFRCARTGIKIDQVPLSSWTVKENMTCTHSNGPWPGTIGRLLTRKLQENLYFYVFVLDLFKMDHPNLGCSEGDCINGKGHYFFYDDLYDYKGDFQDGAPHGSGVLTQVLDIGKITAESGTWKDGLPDLTEIWTLRQIELLEENHSWWYSENTITHTDQYTEYLDLDSFAGNSLVTHVQLDCGSNKVRPTRMLFFNDVMALGGAVAEAPSDLIPIPDDWLDIPVQPKADLYINICEAKRLALEATQSP